MCTHTHTHTYIHTHTRAHMCTHTYKYTHTCIPPIYLETGALGYAISQNFVDTYTWNDPNYRRVGFYVCNTAVSLDAKIDSQNTYPCTLRM